MRKNQPNRSAWRSGPDCQRLRAVVVAAACMIVFTCGGFAQSGSPTEYEVKAVYLYNFSRFVRWPSRNEGSNGNDFKICVLGQDPFGEALNVVVADKTVAGKSVKVERIATIEESTGCRVLFISSSEQKRIKEILSQLEGASVLTVSDMPKFNDHGGMMQFVWQGNRVRFEVNLPNARHAGLVLSAELLKVAANAKGLTQQGD